MITEAKITANRQNSLKSSGPKSKEGKALSCQNSVKHGILSNDLLLQEESRDELDLFRGKIYKTLQPVGMIEEILVEKIINAIWRIRRLTKVEIEIFEKKDMYDVYRDLKQAFRGCDGDSLRLLSRYESTLERNFYKAIHELQRIQSMRAGQHVLAPIAIEVTDFSNDGVGFVS